MLCFGVLVFWCFGAVISYLKIPNSQKSDLRGKSDTGSDLLTENGQYRNVIMIFIRMLIDKPENSENQFSNPDFQIE